jgi:hypothetical protein
MANEKVITMSALRYGGTQRSPPFDWTVDSFYTGSPLSVPAQVVGMMPASSNPGYAPRSIVSRALIY